MISLFIDTSYKNVSISVVKGEQVLSLISENIPNMHSIYTVSFLEKALIQANIKPTQVDNIYVINGPGSFTGLRIGTTVAKTFGYLINKFITPVSSLKALALSSHTARTIMSIIPANKSHYYVGIYNELYENIIEEQFTSIDKIKELIDRYHPFLVGLDDTYLTELKLNKVDLDIVKIINYYQTKEQVNYYQLVPNYLKLPQAVEDKKD